MGIATLTFLAIFLLISTGGLLLFYREAMVDRLSGLLDPGRRRATKFERVQQATTALGQSMVGQFERLIPRSQKELSVVEQRLVRAGYRQENSAKYFYAAKALVPLALLAVVFVTGLARDNFFYLIVAGGLGFIAPDFWLGRRITARQAKIRRGLPDLLDLMVVCVEAGQSLDQATARASEEMRDVQPAISDEIGIVVLEQRAGRTRADAWRQLAERTDVDSVRSLSTVLIQAEQFGTSIARTLRVHSETLRTQRRQQVEEQAAKTTVKLVFPLVLFIFPSLFVVTLGPAMITITETFKNMNH